MWRAIRSISLSYSRAGYSQYFPRNVANHNALQTSPKLLLPYGRKRIILIERHVAYANMNLCSQWLRSMWVPQEPSNPAIQAQTPHQNHTYRTRRRRWGSARSARPCHHPRTTRPPPPAESPAGLTRENKTQIQSTFPQSSRNQAEHRSRSQSEVNLSGRKRTVTVTFSLGAGSSSNPANIGDAGPSSESSGVRRDEDVVVVVVDVGEPDCGGCWWCELFAAADADPAFRCRDAGRVAIAGSWREI